MCYISIKPDFVHNSKSDLPFPLNLDRSNRKAMNRNGSNQKVNPALKTKAGNK